MEKKPVSHILVGTVLGMISVILSLLYYFAGIAFDQNFLVVIPWLISIGLIVYFVVQYSNVNNHNVTFGNLFGYGFRATIIWTLIVIAFTLLFLYIFPEYKVKMLEITRENLDKNNKLSEDMKDGFMKRTEDYFRVFTIGGILFMHLFVGAAAALLGAAIAKKNPVSPFNQTV